VLGISVNDLLTESGIGVVFYVFTPKRFRSKVLLLNSSIFIGEYIFSLVTTGVGELNLLF